MIGQIDNVTRHVSSSGEEDISMETLYYFLMINTWGLGQIVTVLGIITNILNIVTFLKQGVRDSVNISLLGLAVADLWSVVFLFFWNFFSTPIIMTLDLPFYPDQITWHIGWFHNIMTRISAGITAMITFERCLCIAVPLKVKMIITPKRTVVSIVLIYLVMIGYSSPIFYTSRYSWIFDVGRNRSILGITYIQNRNYIEEIIFVAYSIFPSVVFVFIIVCTAVLVKTLRDKSRWRKQTIRSRHGNDFSDRDTKVIKMVVMLSTVFILCFFAAALVFYTSLVDKDFRPDGEHQRLMFGIVSIMLHLDALNAMVNLFIYLKMSSKFHRTFYEIFSLRKNSTGSSQ